MSITRFAQGENSNLRVFFFIHCYIEGIMSGYDKQLISIFFAIKGEKFCPFQDFQGLQPKFKDSPGPGFFLLRIPGLSRIFKDRGNPDIKVRTIGPH